MVECGYVENMSFFCLEVCGLRVELSMIPHNSQKLDHFIRFQMNMRCTFLVIFNFQINELSNQIEWAIDVGEKKQKKI